VKICSRRRHPRRWKRYRAIRPKSLQGPSRPNPETRRTSLICKRCCQAQQEVKQRTHRPESTAPTVADACEAWIRRGEVGGKERSTIRQRRQHVDLHIVPLLGGQTKLSRIDVEAFRDDLLGSRARPMAKKVMTSLRMILKQAKMGRGTWSRARPAVDIGCSSKSGSTFRPRKRSTRC
jgi:hypothetical protein